MKLAGVRVLDAHGTVYTFLAHLDSNGSYSKRSFDADDTDGIDEHIVVHAGSCMELLADDVCHPRNRCAVQGHRTQVDVLMILETKSVQKRSGALQKKRKRKKLGQKGSTRPKPPR